MRKKTCLQWIILLTAICFACNSRAAIVEGIVYDESGTPLPYCNIYLKGTTNGCASNENGYFNLTVEPGNSILIFQYIGFKKKEVPIEVHNDAIHLTIYLERDLTELEEVVIKSDREDPAYEIIRNAIARREEHLKEINAFSCEVYMKGMQKLIDAPDKILGVELKTILDLDSNNAGIVYLSESVSQFHYAYPDKTKEIMVASKVSGSTDQFSWNDARGIQISFYENIVEPGGLTQRGFVSPIASNALFFYDYKLLGSFIEDGVFINKIEIIPKRNSDPVFSGLIYIKENDFRIYSAELFTTKSQGLEFIDTLHISQEFIKLTDDRWVVLSTKFNFNYSFLGIQGIGFFNAFYKNYNLDPQFSERFFDAEVSKIEEGSNKRDSVYWSDIRPIPLTTEEVNDYHTKDSLQIIKETPAYQDSMDHVFNRFSFGDLIAGYNYRNTAHAITLNTTSLPEFLQYNTVEGWLLNPSVTYTKKYKNNNTFSFRPDFRYSFTTRRLRSYFAARVVYDPIASANITMSGGVKMAQFNYKGITPLSNSIFTLFRERNFMKIYEKTFLSGYHDREIANGLYLQTGFEYASRKPLSNYTRLNPLVDVAEWNFTANSYPFAASDKDVMLSDKFHINILMRFTPKQLYMRTPDEKYILDAKYPTFSFMYQKSIPGVFKSKINSDYTELIVQDQIKLHLQGNLTYEIRSGMFLQSDSIEIPDQIHFSGNETNFSILQPNAFFLLPYYYASGDDPFVEGHVQWHTEGFLFNKLPLFKQFKLQPVFSVNYLYNTQAKNYLEFAAGIEHIFKFARVDFAFTPYDFSDTYAYNVKYKFLLGIGF